MLLRAKSTMTIYQDYMPMDIFIEGNVYEGIKAKEYKNLYAITNEQGKQSLFIPELFRLKFEIVEK